MQVLMVAEKPSIAQAIASALSGKQHHSRNGKTPIHEFESNFHGRHAKIKVTAVTGHIYSCDFPKEYANWDTTNPKDLFQAPTVKKVEGSGGIIKQLQSEAKGVDALILWLDCDREGENICFEVIDIVKSKMKASASIYRAKFSAVTKSDIDRAMATLGEPNKNEALSVDVRQELDLKVGVAFSRFQTRFFQGKYGDLDSSLVSYGPCQTPTLGFCVDRHDEIQRFKPEPFWALDVTIVKEGNTIPLEWNRSRLFDQETTCMFQRMIEKQPTLLVTDTKKSETSKARPIPLNTVKLLQEASKALSMGPQTTMHTAERLYLQGYLSYPRTESSSYPDSYDIRGALAQQRADPSWGPYVQSLLNQGYQRPKKGTDAGDHPPITPVRGGQGLTGEMARLYDLVTRYFIATVSPDAKILSTKVKFTCNGEEFQVSGAQVLSLGFTQVLTTTTLTDQYLPDFNTGESYPIDKIKLRRGQTSPPGYLSESELIGMMEKHGIGTDASIATHINNICQRNYVQISSGRTLVPTNLGIVLVHGYYKTDPELVLPKVRANIEKQCTLVAQGSASKEDVLRHSLGILEEKFAYFERKIERMDSLFEATFSPLAATGKPLSKCGKCSRYMKYVRLKPQRLHCNTCNETYNLPQNGTVKLYQELRCPLDNFELLLFSLGNSERAMGKTYPLCPYCYNTPPFEDVTKMGCNACSHPTCKHSMLRNGITKCPAEDCGEGMMVLDVTSKPNWKMACNTCNLIIRFLGNLHSVSTTKDECEDCGSMNVTVEFHKDKSPLGDATTYTGCVLCDDILNSLTETRQGRFKHAKLSRGRGRRRGRGRGRGRASKKDLLLSFSDF